MNEIFSFDKTTILSIILKIKQKRVVWFYGDMQVCYFIFVEKVYACSRCIDGESVTLELLDTAAQVK